jgi:hypothetical protein
MLAGRNQRLAGLTLVANRARAFCHLPVLRLVRDFGLGGVRVAAGARAVREAVAIIQAAYREVAAS